MKKGARVYDLVRGEFGTITSVVCFGFIGISRLTEYTVYLDDGLTVTRREGELTENVVPLTRGSGDLSAALRLVEMMTGDEPEGAA